MFDQSPVKSRRESKDLVIGKFRIKAKSDKKDQDTALARASEFVINAKNAKRMSQNAVDGQELNLSFAEAMAALAKQSQPEKEKETESILKEMKHTEPNEGKASGESESAKKKRRPSKVTFQIDEETVLRVAFCAVSDFSLLQIEDKPVAVAAPIKKVT